MKRACLTLITLVLGFAGVSAFADASADSVKEFTQYISYVQQVAPQTLKAGTLDAGIVYLKNETRLDFSAQDLANLTAIANRQATLWNQTVAGEVQTQGVLQIDSVEELYAGATLLGYRITYGQSGFDMDSCKGDSIATCHLGEVREAAFVSPDFNHVELDRGSVARLQF